MHPLWIYFVDFYQFHDDIKIRSCPFFDRIKHSIAPIASRPIFSRALGPQTDPGHFARPNLDEWIGVLLFILPMSYYCQIGLYIFFWINNIMNWFLSRIYSAIISLIYLILEAAVDVTAYVTVIAVRFVCNQSAMTYLDIGMKSLCFVALGPLISPCLPWHVWMLGWDDFALSPYLGSILG